MAENRKKVREKRGQTVAKYCEMTKAQNRPNLSIFVDFLSRADFFEK